MMVNSNINIFNNPKYYRQLIINNDFFIPSMDKNKGKSLICVFFTKFCVVGCPFCFFHSPSYDKSDSMYNDLENHMNLEGVNKFIKFANDANVGYLQISGGGEPFMEKDAILKCIEEIKADRIIVITSGFWAYNKEICERYLQEIETAINRRKTQARVTIRVSVSKYHNKKFKGKHLINLINVFQDKYKNNNTFTLQLKTFERDTTLKKILNSGFRGYKLEFISANGSDDESHVKVIPWKYILRLKSGYNIIVGKSRIFYPNLRPNLNRYKEIQKSIEVYDIDLKKSQNNNSSVVNNPGDELGLDWIVEYNGNVCTWQNRVQDNLLNIYEDDYKTTLLKTYKDPLTYSYIDKGGKYRENIVNEISSKSVWLMKSVNIRDYAGTLLFQEEKVRLYYSIRVIQDYLVEGKIDIELLNKLPQELIDAISLKKDQLIKLYKTAKYSILDQEFENPINRKDFHDFLELIKLGHFNLSKEDINKAISYYNSLYNTKIASINGIYLKKSLDVDERLTKRMMRRKNIEMEKHIKYFYLYRHGETNFNVNKIIKGQSKDINTKFTNDGYIQIENIKLDVIKNGIEGFFVSDLARTIQTAKIINEGLDLPLYYFRNFRGLNMGKFQGKNMDVFLKDANIKKAFLDYDIKIPGGESINILLKRFMEGINNIYRNYNYDRIAIISHGAAISNIKSYISKSEYKDIDYCVLEVYDGTYKVLDYGCY